MEQLQDTKHVRSPAKRFQTLENGVSGEEEVLFDSFSESREGSAHGPVGRAAAQEARGLFHFLSEAAQTLRAAAGLESRTATDPGRAERNGTANRDGSASPSLPHTATEVHAQRSEMSISDSELQPKGQTQRAVPPAQSAHSATELYERPAPAHCPAVDDPPRQPEPSADSHSQTESPATVPASEAETDGRPSSSSRNWPSADSGRGSGRLQASHGSSLPGWDSACEFSEAGSDRTTPTRDRLPAGMGEKQGSWASASMLRSSRSGRSSAFSARQPGGSMLTDDSDVPTEVFYGLACASSGRRPSPRWGHASATFQDRLFIFGGVGTTCHSDSYVFNAGKNAWAQIPTSKEGPPATYGAAACVSHDRIFLFGGKQNHRHTRRLYSFKPGSLEWRAHQDSASAPAACASHTMTSVGRHGIYVFGGEGRKLSNSVHALDPDTLTWARVNLLGAAPAARQGHTTVWDEADSLIVMGGHAGDRIFRDVRVLSLSTGFWSEAACKGPSPPPRHSHSALLVAANLMLVWGGCGERGAVLNDAWLLNTSSFRWHKLRSIGSSPSGRYCHSCNLVGSRTLLFGGSNGQTSFDSLVSISTDFGRQLGSLADSLSDMAQQSLNHDERSELVRLQLGNHLRQRHAQDTTQVALARSEIAERLFEQERQRTSQLSSEVQHLRLILKEQEAKTKQQAAENARSLALLQRSKDMEMHRGNELQARLQAAMATIQQQEGDAVVVDGYKSMYQRLVAQRGALVERSVDLEYRNQVLEARIAELEAQRAASLPTAPALNVNDPWETEFDCREGLLQRQ